MKIGIITAYPPSKVTLNEYGYYLVKNFIPLQEVESVTVYCDHTKEDKLIDFDDQNKLNFKEVWRFNSWKNLFTITQQILKDKPDVVLINGQFMKFGDHKIPAALGLMLGGLIRMCGFPTVFLIHNILEKVDLDKAGFSSFFWLEKIYQMVGKQLTQIILKSNLVVVTMDKYVEILKEKYHKTNIVQIPHGTFDIPPLPDPQLFEKEKVVMTFGKFGTYKKVEPMIEAILNVRKHHPSMKIKAVIAGTDNPNVPGYLDSVKTKYWNVPDIVYTGYVEEKDVPKIFQESTVVVFPYSTTTGSSGVLHQAGSYAKAAILPNIDDLAELIENEGYRGVYFSPDNIGELTEALEKVLFDNTYRRVLEVSNYEAASAMPMGDICYWYLQHFKNIITESKNNTKLFSSFLY